MCAVVGDEIGKPKEKKKRMMPLGSDAGDCKSALAVVVVSLNDGNNLLSS